MNFIRKYWLALTVLVIGIVLVCSSATGFSISTTVGPDGKHISTTSTVPLCFWLGLGFAGVSIILFILIKCKVINVEIKKKNNSGKYFK